MSKSCEISARSGTAEKAHFAGGDAGVKRSWYAVFTVPQNEKAVSRHLTQRDVENFLPTYQVARKWKNRQHVNLVLPLFPCYLFVRICGFEKGRVLGSPGVLRIIGNGRELIPIPDATVGFLRSDLSANSLQPFCEPVVGERVRIKRGIMRGIEGMLMQKRNGCRFVVGIDLIGKYAAIEVNTEDMEPVAEAV